MSNQTSARLRSFASTENTSGPDPDKPGCCILDQDPSDGLGRFPSRHGALPNGSVAEPFQDHPYRSAFADYLWQAHRATVALAPPELPRRPERSRARWTSP